MKVTVRAYALKADRLTSAGAKVVSRELVKQKGRVDRWHYHADFGLYAATDGVRIDREITRLKQQVGLQRIGVRSSL